MIRSFLGLAIFVVCFGSANVLCAQPSVASGRSFIDYQKGFKRPAESANKKEGYLKSLFAVKGLDWPSKYLYIRSFKYDSQLEVWAKNKPEEEYKLFKIYKVCALVGTLGPKRFEGDYQVPEGFYHINEFNPNSSYYLSLGLNYPNASDRILGDSIKPGGDIFIHGGCATVGCIPLNDNIDEFYLLCANAKSAGQDFIPVHIFPVKYDVQRSYEYMKKITDNNPELKKFSDRLEQAFDYFEKYRQLPVVMVADNGEYVVNNASPTEPRFLPKVRLTSSHQPVKRNIQATATAVAKWPEYPGGAVAFDSFLKKLGKEMAPMLPDGMTKAYVQLEFIIDTDGSPVNFEVIKGVDQYLNMELIARMEKMPKWSPAIVREKPVAKKMVQTVEIGE
ncbi:MAG: L,D-transpeptidase family protein [Niabella sp.]